MELTIKERFIIINLLAREGDLIYLKTLRNIKSKVELTEDEAKKYEIQQIGEKVNWRIDIPQEKEIELSGGERALVVNRLRELESQKKLHEDHLTLYEKFVEQ